MEIVRKFLDKLMLSVGRIPARFFEDEDAVKPEEEKVKRRYINLSGKPSDPDEEDLEYMFEDEDDGEEVNVNHILVEQAKQDRKEEFISELCFVSFCAACGVIAVGFIYGLYRIAIYPFVKTVVDDDFMS